MESYKIARFAQGGASIDYLKNLPLDEWQTEVAAVNRVAEQLQMLADAGGK